MSESSTGEFVRASRHKKNGTPPAPGKARSRESQQLYLT